MRSGAFVNTDKTTSTSASGEPSGPRHHAETRAEWRPLRYEKIDTASAETGLTGTGVDNVIYS